MLSQCLFTSKPRSGKGAQTFSGISMKHSCQKTLESTVKKCQQAKLSQKIKLLIQENSRPQALTMYADGSVTKDQSGWGFTVKQGVTTILEDSTTYAVSTSCLTLEVEAVTHPLRWFASRGDSQITHAILLTDSMSLVQKMKSGMGSPDWKLLQKLLWVYCPGHGRVKGNDQADRLVGKATITSGMCLGKS